MSKSKLPKTPPTFGKALDHLLKYSKDDLRALEQREREYKKTQPPKAKRDDK